MKEYMFDIMKERLKHYYKNKKKNQFLIKIVKKNKNFKNIN